MSFRHAAELNKQQNEVESLKELLYTYEKTMEHKDHIIGNMTKAIQNIQKTGKKKTPPPPPLVYLSKNQDGSQCVRQVVA